MRTHFTSGAEALSEITELDPSPSPAPATRASALRAAATLGPRPLGPPGQGAERRAHTRHVIPLSAGVEVVVALEPLGRFRLRVLDLNPLGLHVEVPDAAVDHWPALQSRLQLALTLGDGSVPIEGVGRVAWLGGARRDGKREHRAGLAFVGISDGAAARIALRVEDFEVLDQ